MDATALTPGQYIKAADLGVLFPVTPTFTIRTANIEEMASLKPGAEKTVDKGVIYFNEIKQGWVMNKTNVACLIALFGKKTEPWTGKRVTLTTENTNTGPGIRVMGSPDISAPIVAEIRLPRKKPIRKTLVCTKGDPLQAFRGAIGAAMKRTDHPWTQEQVGTLLKGRKAAEIPEAEWADLIDQLQMPPPLPIPEEPVETDAPAGDDGMPF